MVQSISVASNNLRLNPQKIEVVALLREAIFKSDDIGNDIKLMKKITELSTLAIRLNEIYNFLTQSQVDFFKLSEKFKEHSQYLIKDLSHMLDMVNPVSFKQALDKLKPENPTNENTVGDSKINNLNKNSANDIQETSNIDVSQKKSSPYEFEKSERDKLKEEIILAEEKTDDELFFQNYENTILHPIKPLDSLLKQLAVNKLVPEDLNEFAEIMEKNGKLSAKIGFDIISNMHKIISKSLLLIRSRDLMPGKEVIESLRACLIVIVAIVKGKEVDITNYLNRAEEFGKKVQSLNVKE